MTTIARMTVRMPMRRLAIAIAVARVVAWMPERAQKAYAAAALRWIQAGLKVRVD